MSNTAGHNWARGYRTYRGGEVVGFVPPLDRLVVREISARLLSQEERVEIADLRLRGEGGVREIGRRVGRAASTISRELRRNAAAGEGYRPFDAHPQATARRARNHRCRIDTHDRLRTVVTEMLGQRWSPR